MKTTKERESRVDISIRVYLLVFLAICVISCKRDARNASTRFVIPNDKLPVGWSLPPSEEMPPNDKMPWLVKNPLTLEGEAVKEITATEPELSQALSIWCSFYSNNTFGVIFFIFSFKDHATADANYEKIKQKMDPACSRVQRIQGVPNAVVFISHDREVKAEDMNKFYAEFAKLANPH